MGPQVGMSSQIMKREKFRFFILVIHARKQGLASTL